MAKTRKSARKSSAKKASGAKKSAPRKKAAKGPKELNLRPLKKQLRAHMALLSAAPTSKDERVQSAIANLQRLHDALNLDCDPTMTIPLE